MLLRFKLYIFLFLLWFFFTLKRFLAKMKSSSFFFWLSQLCPVLGKWRSHWLFVHIHKFLHTPTQDNYHQAMIWLNFQRPSAIELDGVNPALFHCSCLNCVIFFLFCFFMHDILNQVRITLYLPWYNQLWPFLGKTAVFVIVYSFDVLASYLQAL